MSVEAENYQADQAAESKTAGTSAEDFNNYDTVFPSLPSASSAQNENSVWNNTDHKLSIKRHLHTTQIFHVPVEERKYKEVANFGNDTNNKCKEIADRNNVKVEICCSKDQSLHIVISGQEDKVMTAKREIINELQAERDFKMKIPKDQHKFLIGKAGIILTELQKKTCTKIQVPKSDSSSDLITITGPKDGIDQAVHEIQLICDEQSKTGIERLPIPKLYHPWIRGSNNEIATDIATRTGAKVNIPPPLVEKDEVVVSGDREKVDMACAEIKRIYNEKSRLNITKLAIQITKSQHKLIIGKNGSTVQDIFKDYDVYVQVPKLDSPSETIFLYGEESKLGAALSQVIAKSNSIISTKIDVPSWLHRHMIGEKGSNISKITADYPNTYVKFEPDNRITLDGPPDEVEKVKERLQNITIGLKQIMICEELAVDPKFYPQLFGSKKTENHIGRLNKEHGVVIRAPPENTNSNIVRIEGAPDSVQKAKKEFEELLKKLENERSKDIIIDQKYHSNLIGKAGKNLNEIRAKFNDVQINIPSQSEKSDIITIRGNKLDVEKCFKHLQQMYKEMQESNYQEEMQIVKEFHRIIIGKQGAFIKKIRDDTNTRIDIPAENSQSNSITITGKQENVFKARKAIEDKIKELINIKEDFVEIPHQLHSALIGKGGAIIQQIRNDCGGVIIYFPPDANSNRIILKGPVEEIKKAKQELLKLAEQKNDMSYSEEIHAKLEYHRFLVGLKGKNVNSLREKYNVRIVFPTSNGANNNNNTNNTNTTGGQANQEASNQPTNDVITIIGKKENVKAVRAELEETIKNLEEEVTDEVIVDQKWHRHFTSGRGKIINQISEENCQVKISFPKANSDQQTNSVQVKGPRDAVESAKKKILEHVFELENQVTIEVVIKNKDHPAVIGKRGVNTQKISDDFKVNIQFPRRPSDENADNNNQNGEQQQQEDQTSDDTSTPTKLDIVLISGFKDNCEQAKEALLALVPLKENVHFPAKFHKELLANKGDALKEFIKNCNVQINLPKKGDNLDHVTLIGTKVNLENAKLALAEKLEDLITKNYTVEINNIKADLIPQLKGKNGAEAEKLQKKFGVKIDISKINEPDKITIVGVKKNVEECEQYIRKKIEDEDSKMSQEIQIDSRVHSRIIGSQGKALLKITDKFKVEIKFARNSDVVIIKGKNMEQIDDACDHLKNLEEEYLQDVVDKEQYVHPSNRSSTGNETNTNGQSKGFVVRGAPWEQAPDTTNMDDFPTITTSVTANGGSSNGQKTMSWGPSRK